MYRPSHANAIFDYKYGIRAVQGGRRSSARETIGGVAAGAAAKKILKHHGTKLLAYVLQLHKVVMPRGTVDHDALATHQKKEHTVIREKEDTDRVVPQV